MTDAMQSFLTSFEFLQFAAAFIGGLLAGIWLNERRHRRDRAAALRSRSPRYIEVPFAGYGCDGVETLTCDRRQR